MYERFVNRDRGAMLNTGAQRNPRMSKFAYLLSAGDFSFLYKYSAFGNIQKANIETIPLSCTSVVSDLQLT